MTPSKTFTEEIFELSAPFNNEYQGPSERLLFVCSAGILRSATAAALYAQKGYNTRSCGTAGYALIPLSSNLINWAQKIFFVKVENYIQALETFKYVPDDLVLLGQRSIILDIPDKYMYMEAGLIQELEDQVVL